MTATDVREAFYVALGLTDDQIEERLAQRARRVGTCPWCHAKPHQPCTDPGTGEDLDAVHPSRSERNHR